MILSTRRRSITLAVTEVPEQIEPTQEGNDKTDKERQCRILGGPFTIHYHVDQFKVIFPPSVMLGTQSVASG